MRVCLVRLDFNLPQRFGDKVWATPWGCWMWGGNKAYGYGIFGLNKSTVRAHRFAYKAMVGPVADELTLDHLCRLRACVNPRHLEPVTNRENILRGVSFAAQNARKTHCPRGHPYSGYNLRMSSGSRNCRTCNNALNRRLYHSGRLARSPKHKVEELAR